MNKIFPRAVRVQYSHQRNSLYHILWFEFSVSYMLLFDPSGNFLNFSLNSFISTRPSFVHKRLIGIKKDQQDNSHWSAE